MPLLSLFLLLLMTMKCSDGTMMLLMRPFKLIETRYDEQDGNDKGGYNGLTATLTTMEIKFKIDKSL